MIGYEIEVSIYTKALFDNIGDMSILADFTKFDWFDGSISYFKEVFGK